jgi:hypothetical protein
MDQAHPATTYSVSNVARRTSETIYIVINARCHKVAEVHSDCPFRRNRFFGYVLAVDGSVLDPTHPGHNPTVASDLVEDVLDAVDDYAAWAARRNLGEEKRTP